MQPTQFHVTFSNRHAPAPSPSSQPLAIPLEVAEIEASDIGHSSSPTRPENATELGQTAERTADAPGPEPLQQSVQKRTAFVSAARGRVSLPFPIAVMLMADVQFHNIMAMFEAQLVYGVYGKYPLN